MLFHNSMYYLWKYSKHCPKRVTLKINMCLSRAAHHKLSLRHGYCFGKELRSITTIPVCINFRLCYVSKNAESQFSIMQLLNIFFQSFRNVNVCTNNNIFLIFCGIFLFLFFISYAHWYIKIKTYYEASLLFMHKSDMFPVYHVQCPAITYKITYGFL